MNIEEMENQASSGAEKGAVLSLALKLSKHQAAFATYVSTAIIATGPRLDIVASLLHSQIDNALYETGDFDTWMKEMVNLWTPFPEGEIRQGLLESLCKIDSAYKDLRTGLGLA